jgi:polyisoprenoid-binding protein YceI
MFKKFLKTLSLATLLLGALLAAPAWAQQRLVPAQSEIHFAIQQMGVTVRGQFKRFDAQIAFDPAKPEAAKLAFTVDIASATMGSPEIDPELPKPVWFNAAKFPQATFQSTKVKSLGGGKLEVTGRLTVKGSTRDVVVPVTLTQSGAITLASGQFAVQRLAYKIGDNEWADTSMVADAVQVQFKIALTGVAKL